jgi:diguanylate cyclase (GGDEF)-like protein
MDYSEKTGEGKAPREGMAASDPHRHLRRPAPGVGAPLQSGDLIARIDEEIGRAERLGTPVSCLVITIGNLDDLIYAHGSALGQEALAFIAQALRGELRRFDRIGRASEEELAVVLPGADGPRGEIVARRMLARLRSIKVESDGARRPLRILLGLSEWAKDVGPAELLEEAREVTRPEPPRGGPAASSGSPSPSFGRD